MPKQPVSVPVKKTVEGQKLEKSNWPAISHLRGEIDRLFNDFNLFDWRAPFSRHIAPPFQSIESWSFVPAIDVAENGKEFKVTAELPGMEAKDIDIKLSNGSLVIKGEKEASSETKEDDYYVSERQYGSFCRTLSVPEGVDRDKIEASFSNGILHVSLPKTAEAIKSEKTIAVKAA